MEKDKLYVVTSHKPEENTFVLRVYENEESLSGEMYYYRRGICESIPDNYRYRITKTTIPFKEMLSAKEAGTHVTREELALLILTGSVHGKI